MLKENVDTDDLSLEAQTVQDVMLDRLERKELGQTKMPVERICALPDPRRKECSAAHLANGSAALKTSAMDDVMNVAKTFVDPVESTASAARGGGGGGASEQPAPKKPRVLSHLEERRLERLAKAKASSAGKTAPQGGTHVKRRTMIERELRMYVAEDSEPEEDDSSLLEFWARRSATSTCAKIGEVEAGLPYLSLIARLYLAIESTSCQAERNFLTLSFLIGNLRSSMLPAKVERFMFLRLNRLFIPEMKACQDAIDSNKLAAARCQDKVVEVEATKADSSVTLAP